MRDDPTMCMKTKENESDNMDHPTMFIKTNGLVFEATMLMKIEVVSNKTDNSIFQSDGDEMAQT